MSIDQDMKFAEAVGSFFGEYVGTLTSPNAQVRADMFNEHGLLVAHISFGAGVTLGSVTDPYLSELQRFAAEKGFSNNLRVVISGSAG